MKLYLNAIRITPLDHEQRNVWTFEGEIDRHPVQFNYYDSGSNATFIPALSGFHYEKKHAEPAMIEEALNNWIIDNEDNIDSFTSGDVIRLDIKSTPHFKDSPRAMTDSRLVRAIKDCAQDYKNTSIKAKNAAEIQKDMHTRSRMGLLLREADHRLRKNSLSRHFRLQNIALFFKKHPDWRAEFNDKAVCRLSRAALPRMHKKAFHHQSLRRYLRGPKIGD